MLVYSKKKALILRLRDPERVLSVIPKAKVVRHNGKEYIAVKHGPEEVRVLNNIGIKAPSPIHYYYDWPGRFTPFDHQRKIAEFMSGYDRAYNLADLGCVDSETEYLSPSGWKRIADFNGGKVAQYHPETGEAEFVEPTEFVKLPCAEMIRVKTTYGVDQLLSPEHRMIIRDRIRSEKYEVVQAAELMLRQENWMAGIVAPLPHYRKLGKPDISYSGAAIPAAFALRDEGQSLSLSDAELRVQIAVIADGHFPPNNTNRCVVRLKKQRKVQRLRELLGAAGIPWREREQNTATAQGYTVFSFVAPWRVKEFDARFWNASVPQLLTVCDEVMYWDGSDEDYKKSPGKGKRFSTFVKTSADFIQFAFSATGKVARVLQNTRSRRGNVETEYTVHVRVVGSTNLQLKGSGAAGKHRSMEFAPSTDGYKYCFMVPSTFLVLRRNGCVFCTGNTGKTLATLWAYDYLRQSKVVKKALVVTPLSTLERTWADEVFQHFPHLTTAVLHGSREKRLKMLELDVDLYLINHDGIKVKGFIEAMEKRADIDLIIIDELAQVGRTAGTDRFRALNILTNRQHPRRVWGMTGAPTPNAPTDAWAQCRLVTPSSVPPYFTRFRDMVQRQINQFTWVNRDESTNIVHTAMQPSIRFHRDECIDLPECMYQTREVALTPEQAKAYKHMLATLRAEVAAGEVLAVNEAVKAQKLIQICAGTAYGTDGEAVHMDATGRMETVREIIEEAPAKVIVFVPYRAVIARVAEYLTSKGVVLECIHGGVIKHDRDRIFNDFQRGTHLRVLVAQPAAMSHGLTLTAANTIVWYAPIPSNDIFEQANARITRPGQKHKQLIVMIEGSEIERKYYRRLKDKQKVQGLLLDMMRDQREEALS